MFLKKANFFNFIVLSSQKNVFGSGQKYVGQGWVGPLFTAGQNFARVGSRPISKFELLSYRPVNDYGETRVRWPMAVQCKFRRCKSDATIFIRVNAGYYDPIIGLLLALLFLPRISMQKTFFKVEVRLIKCVRMLTM